MSFMRINVAHFFPLVMRISVGSKNNIVAKVLGLFSEPWDFDSTFKQLG